MSLEGLFFGVALVMTVMYFFEREKRLKAERDLAVVVKRKGLDAIGKNLDDTRPDYDSALGAIDSGSSEVREEEQRTCTGDTLLNERTGKRLTVGPDIWNQKDNVPPGEMQDTAQASKPPKFFKGVARADLREGQEVEITVDTTTGTTWVDSKTASPPFVGAVGPSEQ